MQNDYRAISLSPSSALPKPKDMAILPHSGTRSRFREKSSLRHQRTAPQNRPDKCHWHTTAGLRNRLGKMRFDLANEQS
ncbi:hypothetical protein [Propionivibrio dicarboxylicus]|uniref:hypothetical protein n=1 Tax=Propionivibrio dicarboxylicus TaxID=83767 RepID=UPI0015A3A4EF|nr:hypothetical protein [Propionivibrio dicarboxylicus]